MSDSGVLHTLQEAPEGAMISPDPEERSEARNLLNSRDPVFRDLGPYSARNCSSGALLNDAARVIGEVTPGSVSETRSKAVEGSLLAQRTRASRYRVWQVLHYRYLSERPEWVISDLKKALEFGPQSREFVSLLYLHYALRDRLVYDFVTRFLWEKRADRHYKVVPSDLLCWLDRALDRVAEAQPHTRKWTSSTRLKIAQSDLTALRDFGLLKGKNAKGLIKPVVPLFVVRHLLRVLTAEGARGYGVLSHLDWRLFLCDEHEVAGLLLRLAQAGEIGFERVGDTVILDTPAEWRSGV